MLARNDSKLTGVDKALISKEIVLINVDKIAGGATSESQKLPQTDLNDSFMSVAVPRDQKIAKSQSLSSPYTTSTYKGPETVLEQKA